MSEQKSQEYQQKILILPCLKKKKMKKKKYGSEG